MSIFGGRKGKGSEPSRSESKPLTVPQRAARQPIGFETVLGANATLKGHLKSEANIRLDGVFEGTLEIDGNVLVGETAKITADIHAKNVSIAGAVRGDVSGKKVQLLRTGRVWGDITATTISTEEGAFIEGKITMVSEEAVETYDPNIDAADAGTVPGDTTADQAREEATGDDLDSEDAPTDAAAVADTPSDEAEASFEDDDADSEDGEDSGDDEPLAPDSASEEDPRRL